MRQKSMDMKQEDPEKNLLDAVANVPLLNLKKAQSTAPGGFNHFAIGAK